MRVLLLLLLGMAPLSAFSQVPSVEHVVIIGVDGLGPVGLEEGEVPQLKKMLARGAYTGEARGVMPTKSSPNWASMIMGAGPEQHGVIDNGWPLPGRRVQPIADGPHAIFPTIFSILREQEPEAHMAVIHDWKGFGFLFQRRMVDEIHDTEGPEATTEKACEVLREKTPRLTFVHLDHVDAALHSVGFATEAYFEAVHLADKLIGDMVQAIEDAGMTASTAVIVTSDHGGVETSHGGTTLVELQIPWLIVGPGVTPGKTIEDTVNTFDTAATVAWLLGLEMPQAWIGRPVRAAFSE